MLVVCATHIPEPAQLKTISRFCGNPEVINLAKNGDQIIKLGDKKETVVNLVLDVIKKQLESPQFDDIVIIIDFNSGYSGYKVDTIGYLVTELKKLLTPEKLSFHIIVVGNGEFNLPSDTELFHGFENMHSEDDKVYENTKPLNEQIAEKYTGYSTNVKLCSVKTIKSIGDPLKVKYCNTGQIRESKREDSPATHSSASSMRQELLAPCPIRHSSSSNHTFFTTPPPSPISSQSSSTPSSTSSTSSIESTSTSASKGYASSPSPGQQGQ